MDDSPEEYLEPHEAEDGIEEVNRTILAGPGEAGLRLDRYLQIRFPSYNRTGWQEKIRSGQVLINGEMVRPSRRIQPGDRIDYSFERGPEPEINRNVRIIYEDESILVLDKPPNLPMHPSGQYFRHTLFFLLKEMFGDDFVCHFVNRLDRETSGVLLLGKSPGAAATLQKSFIQRNVRKEYSAIVEGNLDQVLDCDGYMRRDETSVIRRKWKFTMKPSGHPDEITARTEFFPIASHGPLTHVRAVLHTGRMHQIRATLFSMGFPMVGDPIYGVDETIYLRLLTDSKNDLDRHRLRISRTALHSGLLEIPHPQTGEMVHFESPIPEDMRGLLQV